MDNYSVKKLIEFFSELNFEIKYFPNKKVLQKEDILESYLNKIGNVTEKSIGEVKDYIISLAISENDKLTYFDDYKIPPLDLTNNKTNQRFFIFLPNSSTNWQNDVRRGAYTDYIDKASTLETNIPTYSNIPKDPIIVINYTQLSFKEENNSDNEFINLENFDELDVPNYKEIYADDFNVTIESFSFDITTYDEVSISNSEKLYQSATESLNSLQKSDKDSLKNEMWTFDEVDKTYNVGISDSEKTSFLIWWQNKAGKQLKGDFFNKYGVSFPTPKEDIIKLIVSGNLFFDNSANKGDRLQPKAIFESGNIWRKKLFLEQETNKADIIQRFGEEVYINHLKVINEKFNKSVWEQRLKVTGDPEQRLVLTPVSPLATELYVSEIIDPATKDESNRFLIATKIKDGFLVEDVLNLQGITQDDKFIQKGSLQLQQAFLFWLKKAGEGKSALKYGVQWSSSTINTSQLLDRYIKPRNNPYGKSPADQEKWNKQKDDAKITGERLFKEFLAVGINQKDQTKIEVIFNQQYNSIIEVDLKKVPIGFTYKKYLDNLYVFTLREFNLRAIKYYLSRGNVGLAYGVGIGKTFCSIFCIKQALDLGLAERVLISVPTQVYFQFAQEIERGLGDEFSADKKLNMFFNGRGIFNKKANNSVNGINLCTYSAIDLMSFKKETLYKDYEKREFNNWAINSSNFYFQGGDNTDIPEFKEFVSESLDTQFEFNEDNSEVFKEGGTLGGSAPIFIDTKETNYDFIVVDEIHNFNALFTKVDGGVTEKISKTGKFTREKSRYSSIRETQGRDSARAKDLYWITQYIQSKNSNWNNTILLSATPFTNSPLQIYSMFAFLNKQLLKEVKLDSILDFFDTYSNISYAEDITTSLQIRKVNKFVGWINIIALQKLLYFVFDKSNKEEEDKAVERPSKIVLPLKNKMVKGEVISMSKQNYVSTTLKQSSNQEMLWEKIKNYAQEPDVEYEKICNETTRNTTKFSNYPTPKKKEDEIEVENADDLSDGSVEGEKSKRNQKALQSLQWGRELTLSPYFYRCSGLKENPTYEEFVETSPKILYAIKCIESVKNYHDKEVDGGSPISGQVIYYDYKVESMTLIRDYLVEKIGFNINEIGIITGKGCYIGKKAFGSKKQAVADSFMGRYQDPNTGKYSTIADADRVKVLIGSRAIREGINLQNYASVLYNLFLDFNPTDQVQLEGRIWRQGNAFSNVRIVIPLMSNSIDVFMFQKLEDKTVRINQIWTKDGQKNEIDTDSFDPTELKYELLSDPNAIARLEIEEKINKLDDEIGELCSDLSKYQDAQRIVEKQDDILFQKYNVGNLENNSFFTLFKLIYLIRPDLVMDKPLLNSKNIEKFRELLFKKIGDGNNLTLEQIVRSIENNTSFLTENEQFNCVVGKYSSKQITPLLARENLIKFTNYSVSELIELTTKVIKEKKIGYPIGYSKNWRDVSRKEPRFILTGDKVEYKTRKGLKEGIITEIYGDNQMPISKENQKILKKEMYSDVLVDMQIIPSSYDIGDIELEQKDIENVFKEILQTKKTAYPDPISYTNKNIFSELLDISEYLKSIKANKYKAPIDNKTLGVIYEVPLNELPELYPNEFKNIYDKKNNLIQQLTNDSYLLSSGELESELKKYLPKLWVDFTERRFETFFKTAKILAESKSTIPKLYEQLNITKLSELNSLISETEIEINTKELEKNGFDDKQLFDEIVQEVIRKQQELLGEFDRQGNTYLKRVEEFANKNSEYGGNTLLSDFTIKYLEETGKTKPIILNKKEDKVDTKSRTKEEQMTAINFEINELKELLEFASKETKKGIKTDIKDLKELLQILN